MDKTLDEVAADVLTVVPDDILTAIRNFGIPKMGIEFEISVNSFNVELRAVKGNTECIYILGNMGDGWEWKIVSMRLRS
jgi:hypothetical protein